MTTISIGDFELELFNEAHSRQSADNISRYDFFYPDELDPHATQVGIKVSENGLPYKSALISATGGGTGVRENSFINEQDRIIICCSDSVFCLAVPSLSFQWKTKADSATCFQIFKLGADYIVHGELEITRLNRDGDILWQQGGADIFTKADWAKDDFLVTDDYILATDWENKKYKFDFDGKLIE